MDLKTKGTELEDMNSSPTSVSNQMKKSCIHCHTTRTPLWRGGPAGPRSLCNACGIRYRKERRALLGINKGGKEKGKRKNGKRNTSKVGVSLKLGFMAMGSLQEEEQAAILLMALSCGSVYA